MTIRSKAAGLLGQSFGYLAAVVVLSVLVGLVRSLVRFQAGTLPDQYLVHSTAVNAALMAAFSVVTLPAFLVLNARLKRRATVKRPTTVAGVASLLGTYFLFWGFNTGIGFRVLREFVAGETKPVFAELVRWLPGFAILGALAGWLFLRPGVRSLMTRCALVGGALLLTIFALGVYSCLAKPSVAALDVVASARRRPDVFLVLVDTLRADHLTTYGYSLPTSPNVDDFAADATVYERAFAPAPWTRPSCASLLSSRYPTETGLDSVFTPLPKEIPILPQFLQVEGYRTAAIMASVQLSAQFGFDKGFDLHDTGTTYLQWTGVKQALSRLGLVHFGDVYPRYNAAELTDRAIEWIEGQRSENVPLFMYLHYADPHAPYLPPEEEDRWREFARGEALEITEPPFSPTYLDEPSGAQVEALVARYDAEVAFFDLHFRRLLDYLKNTGHYKQSLILLTSDHGEEFAEHGGWLHAHSLYNELIHIPLIVKYPERLGIPTGQRLDALTGLLDVVPTIRDVLGARWPREAFRGRSLLRPELGEDGYAVFSRNKSPSLRAVIRGSDKLIQKVDEEGGVVEERYYSLATDFPETADGGLPDTVDEAWLTEMRTILSGLDALDVPSREIELDEETLKELKALGYIN